MVVIVEVVVIFICLEKSIDEVVFLKSKVISLKKRSTNQQNSFLDQRLHTQIV